MRWYVKAGAGLALLAAAFVAGYLWRKPEAIVQTKVQEVEKIVTKVVKVTVKEPNGSTTETTTTEATEDKTTNSAAPAQPVATVRPTFATKYSLALTWTPRWDPDDWYKPTGAELGWRVHNTLWLTTGYDWHTHSVLVGARLEF
jgi:hypothetical protein